MRIFVDRKIHQSPFEIIALSKVTYTEVNSALQRGQMQNFITHAVYSVTETPNLIPLVPTWRERLAPGQQPQSNCPMQREKRGRTEHKIVGSGTAGQSRQGKGCGGKL